ncbi:MAG: G1 family endopeptidase [Chloroflexota bacterium]|nr:G1 family endopeptidase [Chloroflexota bacterium]
MLAVAVFGGLIGVAADRWLTTNPVPSLPPVAAAAPTPTIGSVPRVGPLAEPNGAAPTPTAASATTDPTQQAIQQVIQRGDEEQAQAIATNNPSVMTDTSTADFYQQQVQVNQDLTSNGVAAIKLVGIEWGPISVSGTNATATAWETWTTTYADGTTDQSRDRNVYTLVQDNGAWKVSADAHPDAAVSGAPGSRGAGGQGAVGPGAPGTGSPSPRRQPGTPAQPSQPSQPRQPRGQRGQGVSANWSGYAATGGTYTAVSGTWTVPQFAPDSQAGADAAWVGIGGVNTTDLIQAGTQQTVSGSGSTQYQAWVETLPQASHPVPLTIHPGDSISVSITQQPQAQDQWLVAFSNTTTGQTYQVTEHYTSSMSSAEWIEEAPSVMRGRQLPLDDFGSIDFSAGSATRNGQTVNIASSGAQPISMVSRGGQQLAKPSALGADGASFSVSRG